MLNVLWLTSWYPCRTDAFNGDFVERHAKAVSRFAKVTVLLVTKDEELKRDEVEVEKTIEGNLTVYRVYYGRTKWKGRIEKLFSLRKYAELQKKFYKKIEKTSGVPDIVHVHVAMKAGLLARYLKKNYRIPFVVTEHWTGYYKESTSNIFEKSIFFRNLNRQILRDSDLFLPVTKDLGDTVKKHLAKVPYKVIPNAVDANLFFYKEALPGKFRFIHPSYMNYQKNPEGILEACAILKLRNYDFELIMLGNDEKRLKEVAKQRGLLNSFVFFKAAVDYEVVAKEMQRSSALLLFSRFENLPCVVLESLCCGLPVISSRVGGISEALNEHNGIMVESENIEQLVHAMQQMIDNYERFNRKAIARSASMLYDYDTVGREFVSIYNSILRE